MKHLLRRSAAGLVVILALLGCGIVGPDGGSEEVRVSMSAITLTVGDTLRMDAFDRVVDWTSRAPEVAGIDGDGVVRALRPGVGVVVARSSMSQDTASIRVVPGPLPAAEMMALSPGARFTCGIEPAGRPLCWGGNWWGQLGRMARPYTKMVSPVGSAPHSFVQIGAGANHVCGLEAGGAVRCWGNNEYGQLGAGSAGPGRHRWTAEQVGLPGPAAAIAVGTQHSCALTENGDAHCWGRGWGERPRTVPGAVRFASLSAGGLHTCGINTEGTAYCWGDNRYGQLGDGTIHPAATPVEAWLPANAKAISAGSFHTCAVTIRETAYCWGNGWNGRLGVGSDLHRTEPAELPLAHVGDISAGVQHTCAVTGDGSGYCWGQNNRGQLGVNFGYGVEPGPYGEDTPVRVDSDVAFDRIFVGSEHTCALSGSTPYCWGGNELGQLGTGAARPYPGTNVEVLITPTAVVAPFDE